jgi:hypothetical protein
LGACVRALAESVGRANRISHANYHFVYSEPCFLRFCSAGASRNICKPFYQYCQVPPSKAEEVLCTAYISGLIAGMMYGKTSIDGGKTYCLPVAMDYTQATLIIRRFLENHPEILSTAIGKDVGATATMALTLAFGCRK